MPNLDLTERELSTVAVATTALEGLSDAELTMFNLAIGQSGDTYELCSDKEWFDKVKCLFDNEQTLDELMMVAIQRESIKRFPLLSH